ncbi:DUF1906 domain-containing protein [Actinocrispum sp. NPDC049592]|uniref:DUF1906 domain-containing protein n=1 Tax=Actinocrispum sp. NPDC049592 TaxID=3154835 RepID=UPI0034145535
MNQVLDYSAGFPGAGAIKSAGYAGAVRYIGFPDRRKCTTRDELDDFSANQIGMALVFENSTTDWRGGFGTGQVSARRARDHANAIGFPADRPIYMAVDQDVVRDGEFATMVEYLRGASTSLGGVHVTGVYGEADVIDRARDAGVAAWFWQTAAWSRGRRTSAHLFQRVGTVNVGGVGCDINDVLQEDWGQHNAEDDMPSVQEIVEAIKWQVLAGDWRFEGNRNPMDMAAQSVATGFAIQSKVEAALAKLDALTATVSDDEGKVLAAVTGSRSEILAAVAAIPASGKPTDEQIQDLVLRLREGLGQELAEEVGRRLVGAPQNGG